MIDALEVIPYEVQTAGIQKHMKLRNTLLKTVTYQFPM